MNSQSSILETDYKEPSRPYSQKELEFIRIKLFKTLRLSNIMTKHNKCGHYYYVRQNGRKEKEIENTKCFNTENCSVCWRLSKTSKRLVNRANELWDEYNDYHNNKKSFLSHYDVDTECQFYKWLYYG